MSGCEVCGRTDCATLGYGNPAHKREHHENWARHWRLGYERLRTGYDARGLTIKSYEEEIERLIQENDQMGAALREVGLAATRLLRIWADFTSQETYGEHLREGLGKEDFTEWDMAHDLLRAARNQTDLALASGATTMQHGSHDSISWNGRIYTSCFACTQADALANPPPLPQPGPGDRAEKEGEG